MMMLSTRFVPRIFTTVFVATTMFLSMAAAAETIPPSEFKASDGFEVTIWATTPQLYNPTNFDVDARGRIWVTEAVNYRNYRNEALGLKEDVGDRVVVLEDTDGDGKADESHTFIRDPDLVAPLGIGVVGNKVIVSCAPSILIYTDVDGDTRFDPDVDTKETFLTGFRGLDHDHSLHSVKVGPDGWWYFNVGNGGAHTVTDKAGWTLRAGSSYAGGSPYLTDNTPGRKSDDGRVWVGGVGMRIRPDGTGLEPIGHNFRNPYEEAVTSFGDVFHADNDDPPACRSTWIMEYANAGFSSADGTRSWRVDQRPGQPVRVAEWRQEDPGTLPAGDVYGYGAPTGIVYGENGCFDRQFPDGLLLSCESARGEVFGYVPKSQGAGFALERFVFLKVKTGSAKNGWFRPSDVAIGVDGAIYVSDWYDAGVGGHRMTDASGSGTIYRIAPKGFGPQAPRLDLSTTDGQIEALKNPAVNVRAIGFEALKKSLREPTALATGEDRALHASAFGLLVQLASSDNHFLAARAIWLLPFAGDAGISKVVSLLQHDEPQMRITAFRAIRRAAMDKGAGEKCGVAMQQARKTLATDPSPAVRREVALSLRDVPFGQCRELLKKLADGFDGWDPWYLEALGTACDGKEAQAYTYLVGQTDVAPTKWDRRLASLAWRLHPPESSEALTARALATDLPQPERKRMINALAFVNDRPAAEGMLAIATKGPEDLRGLAAWWGKNRQTNDWKQFDLGDKFPEPPPVRAARKNSGPQLDFTPAGDPIFISSGGNADIEIDIRGVQRLYLVVDSTGPELVKAKWTNPKLIHSEGDTDLTSLEWTTAFSGMLTSGLGKKLKYRKPTKAVLPAIIQSDAGATALSVHGRAGIAYDVSDSQFERFQATGIVDAQAGNAAKDVRFIVYADRSPANDKIPPPTELAKIEASPTLGRALFFSKQLQCVNCHTAEGFGGEIGPDLTQIANKHATPVLFEAILKPSAAIATGFETMTAITFEGKIYNGLMISAGDPVVLKDATGKYHTIAKDDVEEMLSGRTSLMPDLKNQLTAQELASLIAYLQDIAAQ